ncbi:MAG: lipoprotein-releasing ABC transporter permease subunit [Alphaproteobacteria bacterium]|nr:lipoprotein-releasing ABC transporter permease subunit [Alphaproteobacteria bacterium]
MLAWRYIKSKGRERAISAIASFSLIGIALGVTTLIVVTSVMNGFRKEFTERVIGFNGHISVYPTKEINLDETIDELLKIKGIKKVVPGIEKQALISNRRSVKGSLTYGIRRADLQNKSLISNNIVTGSLESFGNDNEIVLGHSLASRSGLILGDEVILIVPEMEETGFGVIPRKKTFRLIATFKSGMHEYDSSVTYIPLGISQKLFKMKGRVGVISIFTDNPLNIKEIKSSIQEKFQNSFVITDWQSSNSSFMRAVEIERNVMFLILTLITLVASFNIVACMIMLVKDKEKDIAILRTIGLSRSAITRVFFTVGASIGVTGTFIGSILGLLFSMNIKNIQQWLESALHTQVFSPEVYFLTHLPSLIRPIDVVLTIGVSLLLSCIATLYPARKASKLNPTEILRYA